MGCEVLCEELVLGVTAAPGGAGLASATSAKLCNLCKVGPVGMRIF